MAVNFCSNCGAKLRAGAKFCGSCGQKIYSEDEKLPTIPYEKSKSVMEVYAEKKAEAEAVAQTQTQTQTKSNSIQAIFSNAKAKAKDIAPQRTVPKSMAEIYAEAKANSQTQAQAEPKYSQSQLSSYTPPVTTNYKEDATIKEKFFSTEGRLNRQRYFNRTLLVNIAFLVVYVVISSAFSTPFGDVTPTGDALINLVAVAMLIPKYCLDIRRLKDIGKFWTVPFMKSKDFTENTVQLTAAMYAVLALIDIYFLSDLDFNNIRSVPYHARQFNLVVSGFWLWMQCTAGMVGANRFGEDPLADERRMNL